MGMPEGTLPVEVFIPGAGAVTYPLVRVTAKFVVVLTDPDEEKTTKFRRGTGDIADDRAKIKSKLMHASLALAEVLASTSGTWDSGWQPSFYRRENDD